MTGDERMMQAWRAGVDAYNAVPMGDFDSGNSWVSRAETAAMRAALSHLAATMPYEALREQVARALCLASNLDPDTPCWFGGDRLNWQNYLGHTDAALAVLLPALEAARQERDEAERLRRAAVDDANAAWRTGREAANKYIAERDAALAEVARLREALDGVAATCDEEAYERAGEGDVPQMLHLIGRMCRAALATEAR